MGRRENWAFKNTRKFYSVQIYEKFNNVLRFIRIINTQFSKPYFYSKPDDAVEEDPPLNGRMEWGVRYHI